MQFSAKVVGKEALRKRLKGIEPALRKYVHPALAKSGDDVVSMAKRFAPVAPTHGGELRDSIRWEWNPENLLGILIKAGDNEAYYARLVEFGSKVTPKQSYFFPAYRALKKKMSSRVKRAAGKAVREGK